MWSVHDTTYSNTPYNCNPLGQIFGVARAGDMSVIASILAAPPAMHHHTTWLPSSTVSWLRPSARPLTSITSQGLSSQGHPSTRPRAASPTPSFFQSSALGSRPFRMRWEFPGVHGTLSIVDSALPDRIPTTVMKLSICRLTGRF